MSDREKNRQAIYSLLKDRKRHLNETDKRSLSRTIAGLTNFGSEFAKFRSRKLGDVPNTVITGLCQILKEVGFSVYLPREADRYNEVSTLCIQETWESQLKYIFQAASFLNMNHMRVSSLHVGPKLLPEAYINAINAIEQGTDETSVAVYLQQNEDVKITHVSIVKMAGLLIVASFSKRGSAHRLLAYAIKNTDGTRFVDSREKKNEKKQKQKEEPTSVLNYPIDFNTPAPLCYIDNSCASSPSDSIPNQGSSPFSTETNEVFNVPTKKHLLPSLSTLIPLDPLVGFGPGLSFLAHFTQN